MHGGTVSPILYTMDRSLALLLDLADAEFDGESFNGPSFMKTLESLSPESAASTATWEGYSAWEVAHHVAYYKYYIARELGAAGPIEPYPFPAGRSGFAPPREVSAAAYKDLLGYLRRAHRCVTEAIRAADPGKLVEIMPKWDIPFAKAAAWLCTHDSYHAAQIRSMGVPGLKEPKLGA